MTDNQQITLAIYPNTKGFGYACMNGITDIIDSGVANIRPITNRKTMKRIKSLIEYFEPVLILVQDPQVRKYKYSKRTKRLIESLIKECHKSELKVYRYSREEVKFAFDQFKVGNKYEIAKKIAESFPELEPNMPQPRKPWKPDDYFMGMFDAISLVCTHFWLQRK